LPAAMNRLLPILASVVILLAYGLAEGYWTDRWSLSQDLAQAPERLSQVPRYVGEWRGEDQELDPRQARQGEIRVSLMRRYVHGGTGEVLTVLLVCGRPGPIAVHSPEVCLGGAGFELKGKPKRQKVVAPGLSGDDAFQVGSFHKPGAALPETFQLHWSWNSGGDWEVRKWPRLSFARKRLLYKLYVSRALSRPTGAGPGQEGARDQEQDPAGAFLKVFLPEVKRALFPG
jgi:hypothetical protein